MQSEILPQLPANDEKKPKKNRDKRLNHSKEYMELLAWTIFVTNIDEEVLSALDLLKIYGYRWRIEIIFKAWKSVFKFEEFFHNKVSLAKERATICIYLILAWLVLFFTKWYNYFFHAVYKKTGKFVSLMKFAKFVKERFLDLLECTDLDDWVDYVGYYSVYDKRKKYPNFCEQLCIC